MTTALPLTSRIMSRVRRRDFFALADRENVLQAGQKRWAPAPISLPDDLSRVIACNAATPQLELDRLQAGWHHHGPTLLRTFSDVIFLDGSLYLKGAYHVVQHSSRRIVKVARWAEINEALLCSTQVINRYFGHWITDGLPLELLARSLDVTPVTMQKHRWQHENGIRTTLGVEDQQVFASHFKTLHIADDRGLNENWLRRMQSLRFAAANMVDDAERPRAPVFIARGKTGTGRSLLNESKLTEIMSNWGFIILQPEEENAETIFRVLSKASVAVAVEGSAQAHAVLSLQVGTPMITIMPPRHFTSIFKPVCDAIGLPWAFTVADDAGQKCFNQPVDRLRKLLDLVM